ncbi:MAG: hypothetical protein V3R94_11210 [Acidobacteriota bacterium]
MLAKINRLCRSTAIDACWRQWAGLGALVTPVSSKPVSAVVDPESLLVLSSAFCQQEKRLTDVMNWWGRAGSNYTSVPRLKKLLRHFPESSVSGISVFAQAALESGDRRWRKFNELPRSTLPRKTKGLTSPSLLEPAALLLRLRAGFGMGVKSDVLALLLGMRGSIATERLMVDALDYSRMAIHTAVRQMARARLIESTSDRPVGYFVHPQPWAEVLSLHTFTESESPIKTNLGAPIWHFWPQLFAFLSHVSDWTQHSTSGRESSYLLSSQARDLYYAHQQAFIVNGIPVPDAESYKGALYLDAFLTTLTITSKWLDENL